MQRLVNAVVAYVKATASLAAFAGVAPGGALGPYWQTAPERTDFPYVVINQISGLENQQGFTANYIARAQLQFTIIGVDADTVATNTEAFAAVFDVIPSLTLTGGEITRKPIRVEEPRFMEQPIGPLGQRLYSGILQYRFNVQRTRGS